MIPFFRCASILLILSLLPASALLASPREDSRWFSSLGDSPSPSPEESRQVAEVAAFRLGWAEAKRSEGWTEGRRGVLATLVSGNPATYEVVLGIGQGWSGALDDLRLQVSPEKMDRQHVVILELIKKVRNHRLDSSVLFRSLAQPRGFAFSSPSQGFLTPGEVVGRALFESSDRNRGLQINRQGVDQLISERVLGNDTRFLKNPWVGESPIYSFQTDSFLISRENVAPLVRYRQPWDQAPQGDGALAAARAAGYYLANATDQRGRFIYQYDADRDRESAKYNLVRHAGSAWSILRLGNHLEDSFLGGAGLREMAYLKNSVQTVFWEGKPYSALVNDDQAVKLGGQALAILAFLEAHSMDSDQGHLEIAKDLGEWILATQGGNGDALVHKYWVDEDRVDNFRSTYYPGEALFALERLSQETGELRWTKAADRLARWIIYERDGNLKANRLPHDHWFLYGASEILARRDWPELRAHATAIVHQILGSQFRRPPANRPEWEGGFTPEPTVGRTAIRLEGLLAIAPHLMDFGLELKVRTAVERGIAFLMRAQINQEISVYFKDPKRIEGAFPRAFGDFSLRIDTSQHALSALQLYAEEVTPGTSP